jgi:hypothetical protein
LKLLAASILATLARGLSANAEFTAELSIRLARTAERLRIEAQR